MKSRSRFGRASARPAATRIMVGLGLVALAAAALLRFAYAPRVLWMHVGETEESTLTGTLELSFDPWTARPANPPRTLAFTSAQTSRIGPGPGGSVVIAISQASQAAAALNVDTRLQYVVDPATKRNVPSDLAWSMDDGNVVDRGSTYSAGLPPGFDPQASYPYHDWVSESVYEIHPVETGRFAGVDFVRYEGEFAGPVAPLFERELVDFYGLPTAFSARDFLGLVREWRGLDLATDLGAALTHVDAATQDAVRNALESDVAVEYDVSGDQTLDFAVPSGAELRTIRWHTRLAALPDVSAFEAARAALATSTDPVAAAALARLDEYLGGDTRMVVYDLTVSSSDDSARASAARRRSTLTDYGIAHDWLPLGLVAVAAGLFGTALSIRSPRAREAASPDGEWGRVAGDADAEAAATSDPSSLP